MRALISLMMIVVAGCATSETESGSMRIETVTQGQPLAGANCTVHTGNGNWQLTTPGNVVVGPANGDLRIICERSGYRTAELTYRIPARYGRPGMGLGVGGGSGGVGVGFGLSFPVGKRSVTYPDHFTVEMNPF